MYPTLFQIGDFQVSTFGLMMVIGFLVGGELAARSFVKSGYERDAAYRLVTWCAIGGVLGAKLWYVGEQVMRHPEEPLSQWLALESCRGGLTWYGATFPRHAVQTGEQWSESFGLDMGAAFAGLRGSAVHPVSIQCDYTADGWQKFEDLDCPRLRQRLRFSGKSTWGPLAVRSRGAGQGLVLPNLRDGKIARSQKEAVIRAVISTRGVPVPVARVEVELHTDAWHE